MKLSLLFLHLSFIFCMQAQAESIFVPRLKNYDLKSQVENDTAPGGKRVLPQGEMFSLASDLNLWKYWRDVDSYYHGPGYWTDTYFELRAVEDITVNARLMLANGSSSYGYNDASYRDVLVGVTWAPDILLGDWKFKLIFFDMDRVTLGTGLFFQDREMSGLSLTLHNSEWYYNLRLPGTSVFQVFGDLYSSEFYRRSSVNEIGVHGFFVKDYAEAYPDPTFPTFQLFRKKNVEPIASVFMRSREELFSQYKAEVSYGMNGSWAGLAGFGIQEKRNCLVCYNLFFQYRYYEAGVIDSLASNVRYNFTPWSLQDRQFMNTMNFFKDQNQVQTYGIELAFKAPISKKWVFESTNEVGRFAYNGSPNRNYILHKQAVGFCPSERFKTNCLSFYVSNKVLNTTRPQPGAASFDPTPGPSYQETYVVGIQGVFSL